MKAIVHKVRATGRFRSKGDSKTYRGGYFGRPSLTQRRMKRVATTGSLL